MCALDEVDMYDRCPQMVPTNSMDFTPSLETPLGCPVHVSGPGAFLRDDRMKNIAPPQKILSCSPPVPRGILWGAEYAQLTSYAIHLRAAAQASKI